MSGALVEVAGNYVHDHALRRWIENNAGLRVPTTSARLAEGLLGFVHGTSFAAPKVAYLAARLVERYPDATPNLLRALLVQSARSPEGVREWERQDVLYHCGFGVPDQDRALFCTRSRATLFYEGDIEVDAVQVFDVPVPQEYAKAKGRKTITITVAYDPPVSVVHRDRPAGVTLTWGLARGDVPESRLEAAIAAAAEDEQADAAPSVEDTPKAKSPFMQSRLLKRPQQRGTVQKSVFEWTRGEHGDPYRLAVTAKAVRPAHARDRQRFAAAVTIECQDEGVHVYQAIRARLAAGRVRVRVPT